MLREAVSEQSDVGNEAKSEKGLLVPDSIIIELIREGSIGKTRQTTSIRWIPTYDSSGAGAGEPRLPCPWCFL